MNLFPVLGVTLGMLLGYLSIRVIAARMGKPLPGLGELMFPMHHTDSKIDQAGKKRGKR